MKLCFFGGMSGGGTENACSRLANELAEKYEIFVLSTYKSEPHFPFSEKVHFHNLKSAGVFKKVLEVLSFLKKNKIDVVISLEAMSGIFTILPTKILRKKLIIWEHANYFQNQGSKYIGKIRKLETRFADAYVVLTNRDLNNFKSNYKCKAIMQYIYNIADERKANTYDINSKTIISAGHLRPIKNFTAIPEVGKIVFKKHPDWCWKIFGNTLGKDYPKIVEKVKEYGIEENVIFCGRSNQLEKEYQNSAMYVMTSLQEGLPMVLLEAKSNGLPLVSFDIQTGPAEIIRDNVNGYLVPPYDTDIMAEKLCKLIENNELRKSFSDSAYLDMEKFDKKAVAKRWEELITTVQKNGKNS